MGGSWCFLLAEIIGGVFLLAVLWFAYELLLAYARDRYDRWRGR